MSRSFVKYSVSILTADRQKGAENLIRKCFSRSDMVLTPVTSL